MGMITLTTDFGIRDGYVAMMKGVIARLSPRTRVIDISHEIDPFDRLSAAFVLRDTYPHFPEGCVHVVVVDPGVGSNRAIVALEYNHHFFLSPDNGILPTALDISPCKNLVRVENPNYFYHPVSATFHGRDIFAPVAAHMCEGVDLSRLGPAIAQEEMVCLSYRGPVLNKDGSLGGTIVRSDRFGNLMTDIDMAALQQLAAGKFENIRVRVGSHWIEKWGAHYQQVAEGEPFVYVGSNGCLEVGVNGGSARRQLGISSGAAVILTEGLPSPSRADLNPLPI